MHLRQTSLMLLFSGITLFLFGFAPFTLRPVVNFTRPLRFVHGHEQAVRYAVMNESPKIILKTSHGYSKETVAFLTRGVFILNLTSTSAPQTYEEAEPSGRFGQHD